METLGLLVLMLFVLSGFQGAAHAEAETELVWHDAATLTIEGKGWKDTENYFDRLPARALPAVSDSVRGLSHYSSGMAIRFTSDSEVLKFRWSVQDGTYVMDHMAASGTSGLDLYVKVADGTWAYAGTGRPEEGKKDYEWTAFTSWSKGTRAYLLNLPLWNPLTSLSIGVRAGACFQTRPNGKGKSVVFYGTSIVNGGCASRPGMAYPAIIGRRLDCETVNLGFSGSAHMEPVMCDLLAELNPDAYVIDALPNMWEDPIVERTLHLVHTLRQAHPATPIILVENITSQTARASESEGSDGKGLNTQLRQAYEQLTSEGSLGLLYVPGVELLGGDTEGTVDGTHPTDLGFFRMAQVIGPVVAQALALTP